MQTSQTILTQTGAPYVELTNGNWRELYREALFEDDRLRLKDRVRMAEDAVRSFANTLVDDEAGQKELSDIKQAMHFLGLLKNLERD